MRQRTSEAQALLGETLTALYEAILTEPLPKRWVPLIHALNAREKAEREAVRHSQMRPTARAERYQIIRKLPLDTWIVVDQSADEITPTIVSMHSSQAEAKTARDRRNRNLARARYRACIVLEPIAQRMGGQLSPTARH
jgi:hypothetical protein